MSRMEWRGQEYRSLWVLLIAVGLLAGVVITSCGGSGGGGSDGELCDQCGDDPDGPCRPTVEVSPGPGQPKPCDSAGAANPCTVELLCRRKVDSSQRRCFPVLPGSNPRDVDYQFRCDGSRPGGTPRPEPTPTQTEAEPAPSPGAQTCNNNVIEGNEVCDGTALAGQTCESLGCSPPGGILSCRAVGTAACQSFNTDGCLGVGCNDTP